MKVLINNREHQKRTTDKKSAKKRGFGGTRVPGGVWGGTPQVLSFVNYFNDFAIFFGYGF